MICVLSASAVNIRHSLSRANGLRRCVSAVGQCSYTRLGLPPRRRLGHWVDAQSPARLRCQSVTWFPPVGGCMSLVHPKCSPSAPCPDVARCGGRCCTWSLQPRYTPRDTKENKDFLNGWSFCTRVCFWKQSDMDTQKICTSSKQFVSESHPYFSW